MSIHAKCKNCGGNLVYSPNAKKLFCENCHSTEEILVTKNNIKHPIDYKLNNTSINNWKNNNSIYQCKNCGGRIVLNNMEMTSSCPYCDADIVAKTENLPELIPDQIIPFQFDKKEALANFRKNISKNIFAPSILKKDNKLAGEISGFYASSFNFDADLRVFYHGTLCRNSDSGEHRTTHHIRVNSVFDMYFRDINIEATNQLNQSQFEKILPYNFNYAVDYNDDFLRGFGSEYYDNSVKQSFDVAKNKMESGIRREILRRHNCDYAEQLTTHVNYSNEKYSYTLLPIYKFNYSYKGTKYLNFMNGQNKNTYGKIPKSKVKITFFTLFWIILGLGILTLCLF